MLNKLFSNPYKLILALLLVGGVANGIFNGFRSTNTIQREGKPDVRLVGERDQDMNKAMQEARDNILVFEDSLKQPKPNQSGFTVKVRFEDDDYVEHMWVGEVKQIDKEKFRGILDNDPVDIKDVKVGDEVEFDLDRVSDWMFVENNKMVGGYTIKVLLRQMDEKERSETLKHMDFEGDLIE